MESWTHLDIKKKNRRMRILGACIFLSFLAGKLRHFNRMLLTALPKKKKKSLAHAYFKHPVFSKFFGGKIKKNFLRDVTWILKWKKKNGGQLLSKSCLEFETPDANKQKRCFRSIRKLNLPKIKWSILTQLSSVKIYFLPLHWTCLWAAGPLSWSIGNWLWLQLSAIQ